MNIPEVPLLSVLREKMSWLNARQAVLAQNVANADVPGYEAHDLKPLDFEQVLKNSLHPANISLATTDPRHLSPASDASPFEQTETADTETLRGGNSVSQEQEMMKVSDTQAQYQAASNLYAKSVQMMRTAIDR